MAAGAAPADPAKEAARRRRRRLRDVFLVGASYAVDGLMLAGFAALGVAQWFTVAMYFLCGLVATSIFGVILGRPQADHYRDPYLSIWQATGGVVTLVIGIYLEPGLGIFFLGGFFVIAAFATLRLSLKESLIAWALVGLAILPVFSSGRVFSMMREFDNRAALLAGLSFMLFIGRCIVVGHVGYRIRVSYHGRSVEAGAANLQLEQRVAERTAELTRTNHDLAQANRHLQAHAYGMAHEFRAPLRAIDGFSALLANEYAGRTLDGEALDFISRTRHAGNRLSALVDDLAQLATVSRATARPQPIDLVALASGIAEGCRRRFPERAVEFIHPPSIPVTADPNLMQSALHVLIDNAWKFTAQTAAARVELGMHAADGEVEVFVRDNGIGFDRAYADKLFGIFQRLHAGEEFEGSGIGLALFERIVSLHGGRVRAEGAPGAGATFYFTLPAAPAAAQAPVAAR